MSQPACPAAVSSGPRHPRLCERLLPHFFTPCRPSFRENRLGEPVHVCSPRRLVTSLLSTAASAPAHASARTSGRLRPGPPLPFRSVRVPQRPPPSGPARCALWNLCSFKNAPHPIKPSQGAPPPCWPAFGDIIPPATLSVAFPPPEPVSWVGATSWDGGRGAPGWPLRLPHPAPPHTHSEVTILNLHNSDRSPNVPSPKANVHPAPSPRLPNPRRHHRASAPLRQGPTFPLTA